MNKSRTSLILLMVLILSACSTSRYADKHDSTPSRQPNQSELHDATAHAEPFSRGGNKNYQVRGINYQVLTTANGFEQTGTASWYGQKFHGHLTSNGEVYDMYAMSAAHKNLPLPTYLKVTNLANNKTVIVRVNDRGPFHQNRIVDLSYSAAYKLDMLKAGTAKVKITAITEFEEKPQTIADNLVVQMKQQEKHYIQVFATRKQDVAIKTAQKLAKQYLQKVNYPEQDGIYRIQIGPIVNQATRDKLLLRLKQNDYPNAYLRAL